MKKIISIILVIVTLFAFVGCGGVADKPAPSPLPPMEFEEADGYTVTGKVTDQSGNPLPKANLIVNKKVRGTTDEDGNYKITALEGENKITVEYHGYKFFKNDIVVNDATAVNFSGTNNYSIMANATVNNSTIYGVKFKVGNRVVEADTSGFLNVSNNVGKTTITPTHPSYDFYPSSVDVYYNQGQPISFKAVPKGETYSVSGFINVNNASEDFVMPNLTILVDGARATDVTVEHKYNYETGKDTIIYRYTVYGLNKNKKEGYTLSYVDSEGNFSKQTIVVKEPVKNANFDYQISKKFYFEVNGKFPDGVVPTDDELSKMKFTYTIFNEKNEEVANNSGTTQNVGPIHGWAGCRITINVSIDVTVDGVTKTYKGTAYTGIVERMMTEDQNYYGITIEFR